MTTRTVLAALLLVAIPHTSFAGEPTDDECPEAFRGASISAGDLRDGVTLTFTTEHTRILQLRSELRSVATALEQKGTEMQTSSYEEDVEFPPVDLEVFDVDGGARVSVRASRPRDIPELRVLAKSFEKYWSTSTCHGDFIVTPEVPAKKPAAKARRSTRQARR